MEEGLKPNKKKSFADAKSRISQTHTHFHIKQQLAIIKLFSQKTRHEKGSRNNEEQKKHANLKKTRTPITEQEDPLSIKNGG